MYRRITQAAFALLATVTASNALAQDIVVENRTETLTDRWRTSALGANTEGGVFFGQVSSYANTTPLTATMRLKNNNDYVRIRMEDPDNYGTRNEVPSEDIDIISFVGDPDDLGIPGETGII